MSFLTNGNVFYCEDYNGAILLSSLSSVEVTMNLPEDYPIGEWKAGSDLADFIVLITSLNNTTPNIDGSRIELAEGETSGTALIRVYPNIAPFKEWGVVTFGKTTPGASSVVCDLKKDFGNTLVDDNISSGLDLSSKGLSLEYVDFLFTLTADGSDLPTLDDFQLKFITGE